MGAAKNKLHEIITAEEAIERKYFDSKSEIYSIPDEVLPRVRRGGKIARPLRFYIEDIERLFSKPGKGILREEKPYQEFVDNAPRPEIKFKKRKHR